MKLRCSANQIRIRVRKSDIDHLRNVGSLLESVALPAGLPFGFALKIDAGNQEITVSWEAQTLVVYLPEAAARKWIESEEVGIEASLPLPGGASLEVGGKDFPCQHQPTANPSDTFHELAP
ncbi:MAG: hypothetical protein IPJ40_06815 [Saprospirales bacterium]|nr:hypothetical protein [Saprospirales bacterium]